MLLHDHDLITGGDPEEAHAPGTWFKKMSIVKKFTFKEK
jgi:hypothetical protein